MNRSWSEWFWLPEKYTWKDFESEGKKFPDVLNFFTWAVGLGVSLVLFRNFILIPFVFRPMGLKAGVRSKPYNPPAPNKELDALYRINRARPPHHMLVKTANKIGWSERKVERWLRQKALSLQMTTLEKFEDFGWQLTYYVSFFIAGLLFIVVKPFFKDPTECWKNFPFHQVSTDMWWYNVFCCSFYVAQSLLIMTVDRRHDFYIMLAHHAITFFNFYFCWSLNAVRMLTITLFMHEIADIPLALGKLFNYSGYNRAADGCFVAFTILWPSTRIIMFPIHGLIPTYYAPTIMGSKNYPGFFLGQLFDYSLLVLHIIWTWELVTAIKRKLSGTDKHARDARSSPEELSPVENENDSQTQSSYKNGNENLRKRHTAETLEYFSSKVNDTRDA